MAVNDFLSPQWDRADKVHDWKNYATQELMLVWDSFSLEQKIIIAELLDEIASGEEWE
ncbi:recombinase RecA [Salmonella enterica subsp. salamae]|nr:recombinase RecA [Salmonella enterica subsp. salamae]